MEFEDTRGHNMIKIKEANISSIDEWKKNNPKGTAKQCSIDLGLSYKTVLKHIKIKKAN